jgi:hypothetical protein
MSAPHKPTLALFALCAFLYTAAQAADKIPVASVDSGSFGVFRNSHRIGMETFSIQESPSGKIISSQISVESEGRKSEQSCELRLSTSGDLVSYQWQEHSPGSGEITVSPKDEFLVERTISAKGARAAEQTLLMPASSTILDNNFFVLRQVLAWRYLATSCKTENGSLSCPKIPARLPAVVPQDHMSMSANVSLLGKEKVRIGQAERELVRLVVDDDSGIWQLWLDDQDKYKLVRMVMAANGVEVVRE